MTLDLAPFVGRDNLVAFLVSIGMADKGVEVGTDRGEFTEMLLKGGVKELHTLDPYRTGYDDNDPTSKRPDRTGDMAVASSIMDRWGMKCRLYLRTSAEAAPNHVDGSLGFVYVDGCHKEESVAEDLRLWWPKLRKGGVMSGHDILTWGDSLGGFGRNGANVQRAVLSFSQEMGVPVFLIPEVAPSTSPWSYYLIKP